LCQASPNGARGAEGAAHYNGELDPAGGSYGTEGSATVHVLASDFTAEYLTFSNSFDKLDFPGVTGTQAVALAMEDIDPFYDPPTGSAVPFFAHVSIDGATASDSVPGAESVLEGYSAAYPLG
jgi:hypothetical protein